MEISSELNALTDHQFQLKVVLLHTASRDIIYSHTFLYQVRASNDIQSFVYLLTFAPLKTEETIHLNT